MSMRSALRRTQNVPGARAIKYVTCCLALLLTMSSAALAGGFQLSVETPAATNDPQFKGAALIVRTYGCWQPADAMLSATAEGLVNGKRQSVTLKMASVSTGVYAIKQEWSSEGFWVIAINGEYRGMMNNLLVELGPKGTVRPDTRLVEGSRKGIHVRGANKKWAASDIESTLQSLAGNTSRASLDADGGTYSSQPTAWLIAGLGAFLSLVGFVAFTRASHYSSATRQRGDAVGDEALDY